MKRFGVDDGPFTNPGSRCRELRSAVTPERFMTQLWAAEDRIIIPTRTRQLFLKAVDPKLFGASK
jgi:hypothetical protein